MALLITALGQFQSIFIRLPYKIESQQYKTILNYLAKDESNGVILAPDDLMIYLFTIYTSHDVFYARDFLLVNMSVSHMKDALFIYSYLNKNIRNNFVAFYTNIMDNSVTKGFYRESDWFYADIYQILDEYLSKADKYNSLLENKNNLVSLGKRRHLLAGLVAEYNKRIPDSHTLACLLAEYNVKYIVWDHLAHSEWDLSVLKNSITPVMHSGEIFLYSFAPPNC